MSKYSKEFKLEVIKYYLEENQSYSKCCEIFNIPSQTTIRTWINKYKTHGIKGIYKYSKSSYDGNFKRHVIKYMHSNYLSATETAYKFKLSVTAVLKWERIYYEKGSEGLDIDHRGRPKNMSLKENKNGKNLEKKAEKDLISEIQFLRMENEYLKKLNALVQERIKRENKKK